jgi:type IV secretory pathway TrbD component
MMGCERFLFLMVCMVLTLLAGPGGLMIGKFLNVAAAAALFFPARALLGHMAKKDALMSDVFRRSVLYRREYPASGTTGLENPPKARRWQ